MRVAEEIADMTSMILWPRPTRPLGGGKFATVRRLVIPPMSIAAPGVWNQMLLDIALAIHALPVCAVLLVARQVGYF